MPDPVTPCGCGALCWVAEGEIEGRGPCGGEVHACDEIDDGDGGWSWMHECQAHDGQWERLVRREGSDV